MTFQPYPIYDLKSGKKTDKDPWLQPSDAFTDMLNCHLRQGALEKRKGYTEFGEIAHTDCDTEVDSSPGNAVMGIYNYYSGDTEAMLAFDTRRLNKWNSSSKTFVDSTRKKIHFKAGSVGQNYQPSGGDTLTGDTSGATATVEAVIIDYGVCTAGTAHGTIILENGTLTDDFSDGETLKVSANIVGVADGIQDEQEFTGDDGDFFWVENWKSIAYIANGVDQIQKYNGAHTSRLYIDLDTSAGPDNHVSACLFIFAIKGRIVIFRTIERGNAHKQRARWCDINNPQAWQESNYVDAPTEDWIVAADFIGEDLIVWFERSIWKFAYTGDVSLPFRWEKLVGTEGAYATYSLVAFSDEILGIGPTRLIACDGRDAYGIDDKIPDFILETNPLAINYSYALVLEEMGQAWFTFAKNGDDKPNNVLVLDYDNDSWSTYELPAHTLGYSSMTDDTYIDDIEDVIDTLDYSFDDKELQAGYPTSLMGTRDGYIYQLNNGGSDAGTAIEFYAVSSRWNPYVLEGYKARLGWIDFLVDSGSGVSFDVQFYLDTDREIYKTVTVNCTGGNLDDEKVWVRVKCGAVGKFHKIKITNDAIANRPVIHAIIPYFKKAGKMI